MKNTIVIVLSLITELAIGQDISELEWKHEYFYERDNMDETFSTARIMKIDDQWIWNGKFHKCAKISPETELDAEDDDVYKMKFYLHHKLQLWEYHYIFTEIISYACRRRETNGENIVEFAMGEKNYIHTGYTQQFSVTWCQWKKNSFRMLEGGILVPEDITCYEDSIFHEINTGVIGISEETPYFIYSNCEKISLVDATKSLFGSNCYQDTVTEAWRTNSEIKGFEQSQFQINYIINKAKENNCQMPDHEDIMARLANTYDFPEKNGNRVEITNMTNITFILDEEGLDYFWTFYGMNNEVVCHKRHSFQDYFLFLQYFLAPRSTGKNHDCDDLKNHLVDKMKEENCEFSTNLFSCYDEQMDKGVNLPQFEVVIDEKKIFQLITTDSADSATNKDELIEEDWEMLYPEFIKLDDTSLHDYPYQIDGKIPVFKKRSSDTDMNDYTVAVFYDDEKEDIKAVYILVEDNQTNEDIVTHYINWEQEISVDSIISRSGSRKLKSIKCQGLTQVESQDISCMPIEKIMKYTYNKDENIIKPWEGTEVFSIEIYSKKFAIRSVILWFAEYVREQGLQISKLFRFFYYLTVFELPIETIENAINNIKRTYNSTYLPFTEFCSHARELLNQIDENKIKFDEIMKIHVKFMAHDRYRSFDMDEAKATLVSYGISKEKLVDAETKDDLWGKLKNSVSSMTYTELKLFGDNVMQDYEKNRKSDRVLRIGEVEIGCLCETGW